MKVAALYDIHGNLPALEAVLADVDREGVDATVFGGDVDGGPFPSETLDLLLSLSNTRFVMGNADRFVVEDVIDPMLPEPVREGLSWSHDRLSADHRAFLASFQKLVTLEIDPLGPVLFCHGSPRSDEELVTAATPDDVVAEMVGGVGPGIVV